MQARGADLAEIVAPALEREEAFAAGGALQLEAALVPAPVVGDPVLLERLAENLIENAVRYNAAVGWVRVRTGIERGEAVLHVTNPGARIDPARRRGAARALPPPGVLARALDRRLRPRPGRRPRRGAGPRRPRRGARPPRGRPRGDGLAADGLGGRRRADRQHARAGVSRSAVCPARRGAARRGAPRRERLRPRSITPLLLTEVLRLLRQVSGVSRPLRRDHWCTYDGFFRCWWRRAYLWASRPAAATPDSSQRQRRRRSPAPPTASSTAPRPARARRAVISPRWPRATSTTSTPARPTTPSAT